MASIFGGITSALQAVRGEKQALTSKLEALKREREDVMMLPLPKEDVIKKIGTHVDLMVNRYRDNMIETIKGIAGTPLEDEPAALTRLVRPAGVRDEVVPDYALFALIGPERIKKALTETVSAMDWPNAGIPFSQRKKEIDRLDGEIAATEKKLRALLAEAESAGVRICD